MSTVMNHQRNGNTENKKEGNEKTCVFYLEARVVFAYQLQFNG